MLAGGGARCQVSRGCVYRDPADRQHTGSIGEQLLLSTGIICGENSPSANRKFRVDPIGSGRDSDLRRRLGPNHQSLKIGPQPAAKAGFFYRVGKT